MKKFEIVFWSYMQAGSAGILSEMEIDARNVTSALNKFKKEHFPNDLKKRKKMSCFQRLIKKDKTVWSKIITINEIIRTPISLKEIKNTLKQADLSLKGLPNRKKCG